MPLEAVVSWAVEREEWVRNPSQEAEVAEWVNQHLPRQEVVAEEEWGIQEYSKSEVGGGGPGGEPLHVVGAMGDSLNCWYAVRYRSTRWVAVVVVVVFVVVVVVVVVVGKLHRLPAVIHFPFYY